MLLERLKCTFCCGLTFTVGTSLAAGATNAVTWGSIHHKTSLGAGLHRYPDSSFFDNWGSAMDMARISPADDPP
jgi:hypothetical protein